MSEFSMAEKLAKRTASKKGDVSALEKEPEMEPKTAAT